MCDFGGGAQNKKAQETLRPASFDHGRRHGTCAPLRIVGHACGALRVSVAIVLDFGSNLPEAWAVGNVPRYDICAWQV